MIINGKTVDYERAFYGLNNDEIVQCRFEGPADGESPCKECNNLQIEKSYFDLRYPLWHNKNSVVFDCEFTENSRAPVWYSKHVSLVKTNLYGIKAVRECCDVVIDDCDIVSPEFGWNSKDIFIDNATIESEYFLMNARKLDINMLELYGKYSFQYVKKALITDSFLYTKDAFWHAKNVTVKNTVIDGEYTGWYSENLTFINCTIKGTQPFCYCKNLKLINCKMIDCDLAFEKSSVKAFIETPVLSIKNAASGKIIVPSVGEIIADEGKCKIIQTFIE